VEDARDEARQEEHHHERIGRKPEERPHPMAMAGHDRFVGAALQETLMGLVLGQPML
jgi:hypothetical protein